MRDDLVLIALLAFVIGLFFGEYSACPRGYYSLETGCKVER